MIKNNLKKKSDVNFLMYLGWGFVYLIACAMFLLRFNIFSIVFTTFILLAIIFTSIIIHILKQNKKEKIGNVEHLYNNVVILYF